MKILQINTVCGTGSTGRIATDLYDVLVERGYECCIAYGRGNTPAEYNTIKIGNDLDVYHHAFMNRLTDRHGLYSTAATKEFIKKVEEYGPDIIHLHNIHGYYINIKILFAYLKKTNKPVVWTLHDCWAFTGHCAHFEYIGCDRWQTGCYDCPQKGIYPATKLLDASKDNYSFKKELFTSLDKMNIVTPSKWLANLVKYSFLREYPVQVINNEINEDIFKPTDSDFRKKYNLQSKFIILGVANIWTERKGLNDFIKLAGLIDDEKQAIVLVGLNDKQLKDLPVNIIGINRIDSAQELAEIYSVADVFLNPTYEDTYSMVNLEAMACGTPVVTYGLGGTSESVDNDRGIVLDKEEALDYLVNQAGVFKKMRKFATEKFDKRCMFAQYIRLYKNMYKAGEDSEYSCK